MVRFAFVRLDLQRLEAETIADNVESVRLLERLGFVREGTRRAFSYEDDERFHDAAIYGLLKREAAESLRS